MTPSPRILSFVKSCEGLRLQAYRCPAGVPTIGYGHTQGVAMGQTITADTAERMFLEDARTFATELDRWLRVEQVPELRQRQYDALFSFAYNIGIPALRSSTLFKKVKADPDDPSIPAQFLRWVYAGGKPLEGLRRRRQAEAEIYARGQYPDPK